LIARDPRNHVDKSVGIGIVMGAIDEAHVEPLDAERRRDPFAELAQHVPDVPLFGDIEIVKCGDVAPGSYDHMTGSQRRVMRYGYHIVGENPDILGD
jgi:hypothetical protein